MTSSPVARNSKERPLRRDAELNRQRILRAAAEVFGERGLEVTLDDIAHHAGVGVGTVYRRFPNKEALAGAVFVDKLNAVAALAEKAVAKSDPWEALASFVEEATEEISADRGLRQMAMYAIYANEEADRALRRLQRVATKLLERAQAEGVVRGDLEPADFPLIEFMLTTAAEYAWHVRPNVWRRYLGLVLDGLRPARSAPTPLPEPALSVAEMRKARFGGASLGSAQQLTSR
jgi:AcrR family transcriptional regulator